MNELRRTRDYFGEEAIEDDLWKLAQKAYEDYAPSYALSWKHLGMRRRIFWWCCVAGYERKPQR